MTVRDWSQKLLWASLLISVSAFGFLYIDAKNALASASTDSIPLATALDAHIPLIPDFVYAYMLYYVWLLLPLPILRERADFFRALAAFTIMQLCAGTAFLVFPSHMVRPAVEQAGLAGDLVRWIYRVDQGWNVFPSLHVGHSVLVALLFWAYQRKLFPFAAVGAALICASTVLIKQHYVVDIPAGVLLAWGCYRVTGLHSAPESDVGDNEVGAHNLDHAIAASGETRIVSDD